MCALDKSAMANRQSPIAPAFTLVELMISVALVLLLMIGINQVFKVTGEAVGTSQAVSTGVRDARAAHGVFSEDFRAALGDEAPCMLLLSRTQPAFRNRADELSDRDYTPPANPTPGNVQAQFPNILSIDLDGNGREGELSTFGERIHPTTYNYRNHRTDTFSFFAQGLFRRQTGGDVLSNSEWPFIADMTTREAWIWYGHLRLPDGAGSFTTNNDPGEGTFVVNPNNFHASNWILGRVQILLTDKDADTPTGKIYDRNGREQYFIDRTWTFDDMTIPRQNLSPLRYQSAQNAGPAYQMRESRYDLAAITIKGFRDRLKAVIADNDPGYPINYNWFTESFLSHGRRFQCNPFAFKPVSAATYSQQFPVFLQQCSQFIVEYAGDFVEQDNDPSSSTYGNVRDVYFDPMSGAVKPNGAGRDGVIDYVVINKGGSPADDYPRIRWYGLPRDTNGDGRIPGAQMLNHQMPDVVPLRDIIRTAPGYSSVPGAPFEKFSWIGLNPPAGGITLKLSTEYAAPGTTGMESHESYVCAWGPDDPYPKLIRIIYTIEDPMGRIAEGQTFEYVFRVGG